MTSITDIDHLVSELQEARDYLQSEGERIRAEVAHYAALAGAASASGKIIFDVLRAWRTTGHRLTTNHKRAHLSYGRCD